MPTPGHNAAADARNAVRQAHAGVAHADWQSAVARSGLAAKGVLYAALGILAINVAAGNAAGQTASKRGAIELVASQPFGQWLLGILTAGLFALALWQFLLAFRGDPVEGSEPKDRAKYAGKALIYLGTASTALGILVANWSAGGGGASQQQAASEVMSWPGGPWLVGAIGLAVIAAAVYQFNKNARHTEFMQRLSVSRMSAKVRSGVEKAGRAGYASRAIVLTIVGAFLVIAAMQHDPQEAIGLSGALAALAGRAWGQAVLWFVAIGLFLFGCFSFAEARYRRAT
jgi:hypothetical protein